MDLNSLLKLHYFASQRGDGLRPEFLKKIEEEAGVMAAALQPLDLLMAQSGRRALGEEAAAGCKDADTPET